MSRTACHHLLRIAVAGLAAWGGAARAQAQVPTFVPFSKSGIYEVGEMAGWNVALPAGTDAAAADYRFVLRKNDLEVIKSGRLDFSSGSARIEARLDEPAMLYVEVSPATANGPKGAAGAAVGPTKLQPCAPRPDDFDAFWDSKIKLLDGVPAGPVVTPGESGRAGVEYSTIRLNNLNGAHVHGQLARPAGKGKHPAMLILQWANPPYPLQKEWVTQPAGNGWIALNVEPHDVPGDMPAAFYAALPQMIKDYRLIYDHDRDRNYFLQMYLGDYRALDFLAGLPDWDGKTLLVTGISMGGQQAIAVAGLHAKVTHLMVLVPAGADSNGLLHGRKPAYPNWNAKDPQVMKTGLYFDTVNFASRIKATSLVAMGFVDEVCPPAGTWTVFNQIRGPKEVVPLVTAPHNHQATAEQLQPYTSRAAEWLSALVRGAAPTLPAN